MIIHTYYVYSLVHAGEVPVEALVVFMAICIVASVIAQTQKAKECGTCDLKVTVSVDKYSMRILVCCTVNVYEVWR